MKNFKLLDPATTPPEEANRKYAKTLPRSSSAPVRIAVVEVEE